VSEDGSTTAGAEQPLRADAPSEGRVRAILGPTAAGKSALALQVAEAATAAGEPHEIVAIDAFTVYRGMDVATAKPSLEDRRRVPHHLVDVLDPAEELTVVRFRDLARAAIADVHSRGATALLVGGSGLYWRAVVDGLSFPPTDAAVRERITSRLGEDAQAAHAELAQRDRRAADGIPPRNLRRIIRALEVLELTGTPFSAWDDGWSRYASVYPRLDVAYLEPPAEELRHRITRRAEAMISGGLLEEARALSVTARSRTASAAIGYREAAAVLAGELTPESLARTIAERTWRYARRQRAWFRADPRCAATQPDEVRLRWTVNPSARA
jgi:tRNA dimethylallyltransferase